LHRREVRIGRGGLVVPHVASPHSSSSHVPALAGARPQSANASSRAASLFESLVDEQDAGPPATGKSAPDQTSSPAVEAAKAIPTSAPATGSSASSAPSVSLAPADPAQAAGAPTDQPSAPAQADPIRSTAIPAALQLAPLVQEEAPQPAASAAPDGQTADPSAPALPLDPAAPVIVDPNLAKSDTSGGKPAPKSAGAKDETRDGKPDPTAANGAQAAAGVVVAAIGPVAQPANQPVDPSGAPQTTNSAAPVGTVQTAAPAQPTQTPAGATAAQVSAATAAPSDDDGAPEAGEHQTAAAQPQTPSLPAAQPNGSAAAPVANPVAAAKAAPESAIVLPRIMLPADKVETGKAAADPDAAKPKHAAALSDGQSGETSGIGAADTDGGVPAPAPSQPSTPFQPADARPAASQPHHPTFDGLSAGRTDKTASSGDLAVLQADAGGTAIAVSSVPSHAGTASTAQSASSSGSAAPAATAVPLAGIPLAIAARALAGERHFDIRLDPPELGRIEVRMKVDRDGRISSHLIADRRDTLDLLRRDGAGLERALQDAGLKTAGDGLQFSLRDQSPQAGQDGRQNLTRLVVQDDAAPVRDALPASYGRLAGRIGGLDIRV
jgi:flagellar hook-length control protein FliK